MLALFAVLRDHSFDHLNTFFLALAFEADLDLRLGTVLVFEGQTRQIFVVEASEDLSAEEEFDGEEFVVCQIEFDYVSVVAQIDGFELVVRKINFAQFKVVHQIDDRAEFVVLEFQVDQVDVSHQID